MNAAPFRGKHVHLMGIGGSGMSALVPLLRRVGAEVSGCDLADSATVTRLRDQGISVALGHAPEHVQGAHAGGGYRGDGADMADALRDPVDLVVFSSAVPAHNAELRAARSLGLRVMSRAACLAELMRGSRALAVAGSHGKTTTAWFTGHLLSATGHDPVVAVGGSVPEQGVHGSRLGGGHLFIAEVDESDGGFAHVAPDVAIITNLDDEHVRHYGSFAALCQAFQQWLLGMDPRGTIIIPHSGLDPRVTAGCVQRIRRVGIHDGDIHATNIQLGADGSQLIVVVDGCAVGHMQVPIPGLHMVHNALMAYAAAITVDSTCDPAGLADCARVRRRFTVHQQHGGVRVVEDYAHHPREIIATLAAAALAEGRVHAIFQPHRWTRSADCFHDLVTAFDSAATLCVLPVYAAGESPIAGVDGSDLAEAVGLRWRETGRLGACAQYAPSFATAAAYAVSQARADDTIIILGAGDVGQVVEMVRAGLPEPTS